MVNTDWEEKERKRKYTAIFPIGGGEDTNLYNMELLYASI